MSVAPNPYVPNITKLDSSNYEGWRKAITGILAALRLWPHVTGDAAVTDYASDTEYNAAALRCYSTIINTIDYSQYGLVHENDTARQLWKRLETYFRPRGFGTRLVMRRNFFKMRKSPDETMVQWIGRVDQTVERLRGIGAVVPDDDIMVVLIEGLPKDYDTIIAALDTVPDNLLTVAFVKSRLVNEHSRLAGAAEDDAEAAEREEARAMASYRGGPGASHGGPGASRRGFGAPRGGARRAPARCPAAGPSQHTRSTECHRCGRPGHIAADCRTIMEGDRYASDDDDPPVRAAAAFSFLDEPDLDSAPAGYATYALPASSVPSATTPIDGDLECFGS